MTVSSIVNRIVNGYLSFMLFVCFALWCMYFTILRKQNNHDLALSQPSAMQEVVDKSGKRKDVSVPSEFASEKDVAQMRNDSTLEMLRETSKPWIREALHDPMFRRTMALTQARMNDSHYADVFKLLELDDATSETLRELLGERPQAIYETMMDSMARPNSSLMDAIRDQPEKAKQNHDEMIAKLLGAEKYEFFCEYERTMPFRNQISQFRRDLEFSGDPLTLAQETALFSILEGYSENDPSTAHLNEIARLNPWFTPPFSEGHLDALKDVLSAKQINALAELMERKEKWQALNYSWKSIGKRMMQGK